jgi:uncharacterized membrane protein
MAGIGFALRRLAQRDSFGSSVQAYGYALMISGGPWMFTVAALAGAGWFSRELLTIEAQPRFSIIIIYNFAASLVAAGPLVLVATRDLADRIYAKNVADVPTLLFGALGTISAVLAVTGLAFWGWVGDLTVGERAVAYANLLIVGGIWIASAFLSATKSFVAVSVSFAVGMGLALLLSGPLGARLGAVGILLAMTIGLAVVLYSLLACILAIYPDPVAGPALFWAGLRRYWEYAVAGLAYNAATWVDKWIMWLSPDHTTFIGGLPAHPAYDAAMFLAILSALPSMALFLIAIETRFYEIYLEFYHGIAAHATLAQLKALHRKLVAGLTEGIRSIAILQAVICYTGVVAAPVLIDLLGGGLEMIPIFRLGLLGAMFHALLLFALVVMSYFDLRRPLLAVCVLFFVSNAAFTWISVVAGPSYSGYGYFASALVTTLFAYVLAARNIKQLLYVTFVTNNCMIRIR